jgi:L-ascorbate metabolism protein UlaG (beta-lactamase superfamily)
MDRRTFVTTGAAGLGGLATLLGFRAVVFSGAPARPSWNDTDREARPTAAIPIPASWSDNAITLAWLGHATVLINFYGVWILTDPAIFPRIGVDLWITTVGMRRHTPCALLPSQLPAIDLVLVSHAHFDHLDTASLAAISGRPAVVMAPHTADLLPRAHYSSVHELRWRDLLRVSTPRGDVDVRAIEVNHWGARLGSDTYRGYNGYIITREGHSLLFGGDTARTSAFAGYRVYGPFDAAIMPIGAYDPWIDAHCTPEQSVAMANAAGARLFVPIHHKTFQLSDDRFGEPIERTAAALAQETDRLVVRDVGDTARLA